MKGNDFDQFTSPVLTALTIHRIVSIYATYHITIVIVDVTNAFHNTLKASPEL